MVSKWAMYNSVIDSLLDAGKTSWIPMARAILAEHSPRHYDPTPIQRNKDTDLLRTYIKRRYVQKVKLEQMIEAVNYFQVEGDAQDSVKTTIKTFPYTSTLGADMDNMEVWHSLEEENQRRKFEGKPQLENRVLIIGDLHEPFCLDGYLEHCINMYKEFNCNQVVFIGDVIDNHYSSFHTTDVDGLGGGHELELAISKLQRWVKAFPNAYVTLGNHDRIILRKAFEGQIPKIWIKSFSEVLGAPNWEFVEQIVIDDVMYIHGEGGTARARMRKELHSLVQGHLHIQGYIDYQVGNNHKIFGMQVGCGIDHTSYAMAYGKNFGKPFISCGVILNNGKLPILLPMEL